MNKQELDGPSPLVIADQAIEAAARSIHEAYCKCFAKVGYDSFRDCWRNAAVTVLALKADPARYVEAQVSRVIRLDPEDLTNADCLAVYMQEEDRLATELKSSFAESRADYKDCVQRGVWHPVTSLGSPFNMLQSTFRVFHAKTTCSPEEACFVMALYGQDAAREIRSSSRFREALKNTYPLLDVDAFVEEMDLVSTGYWARLASKDGGQQ